MNSRFQGSVCLLLGIVGLSCFLLFSDNEPRYSISSSSSSSVLVPLADDSWQVTYWGQSVEQQPSSSKRYAWTVTVSGLPKSGDGVRTLIINCVGQPLATDDWGTDQQAEITASYIYEQDAAGRLQQLMAANNIDTTSFPVELLLLDRPVEFSLSGPSLVTHNLPLGQVSLQKIASSRENGTVTYGVGGHEVSLTLGEGERRAQLIFDKKHRNVQLLSSICRLRTHQADVRTKLDLHWGHAAKLPVDRVHAIEEDLVQWRSYLSLVRETMNAGSLGSSTYDPSVNFVLCEKLDRIKDNLSNCKDTVSRECLTQFTSDLGFALHRVQLGWESLNSLQAESPMLRWQASKLDGENCDARQYLGKVAILGFTCCSSGSTARQALETLERIKQQFANDEVEVLAFATDSDDISRHKIAAAIGYEFDVLDGAELATELGLFRCGIPTILIQCPDGTLHSLHTYQNLATEYLIVDQIEALLEKHGAKLTSSPQIDRSAFSS